MAGGYGNRRMPRDFYEGLVRPKACRPCPPDFREVYLENGWDGIEEHFRTNSRVIARWIDESGGEELIKARRKVVLSRPRRFLHSAG